MIINDDSTFVSKRIFELSDDPRVVIYDCHRFIIQATGQIFEFVKLILFLKMYFGGGLAPSIQTV